MDFGLLQKIKSVSNAGFRLHSIFVTIVTATPEFLPCCGQETSEYMLLPDQSLLAIFNDVHNVIEKAELVTDLWKKGHKKTTEAAC